MIFEGEKKKRKTVYGHGENSGVRGWKTLESSKGKIKKGKNENLGALQEPETMHAKTA
jgi:hypothetical protein